MDGIGLIFLPKKKRITVLFFVISIALSACAFNEEMYKKFLPDSELNGLVIKANAAMTQGDWGKAMTAYEKAVVIAPHDLELRMALANAYEHDGRKGQALVCYQFVINDSQVSSEQLKIARDAKVRLTPVSVALKPTPLRAVDMKREEKFQQVDKSQFLDFVIAPAKDVRDVPTVLAPDLIMKLPVNNTQLEREVHQFLDSWRDAWISRNLKVYFDHYVNTFSGDCKTAVTWRNQRKAKLAGSQLINLNISDVRLVSIASDQAEVTFMQQYQAGSYKDKGKKLLKLLKIAGRWQIVQESFNS